MQAIRMTCIRKPGSERNDGRKMNRLRLHRGRAVALATVLAAAAIVATLAARAGATQRAGGQLTVLMPAGDPDHLDPALWYTLVSWNNGFTICDTLVTYPDAGGEPGKAIVPGLASLP